MKSVFKAWTAGRRMYLDFFESCSLETLNKIPNGFNNNLIWNIGHILVTQQKLVYKGANLQGYIPDDMFNRYRSGTKPTVPVTQSEVDEFKYLLISLIDKTEQDYAKGLFVTYNTRITGIGFHLSSIQDAFECNNFHEGLHLGYMKGLRKLV